jgi:hypothetical protein
VGDISDDLLACLPCQPSGAHRSALKRKAVMNDHGATGTSSFMHAKKRIGGKDAPVNYSFEERVFCAGDTAPDKAAAKLQVAEMLRSRILSAEKPQWEISNSNWDNMQMTGKCYKRTNVNAEVRRTFAA